MRFFFLALVAFCFVSIAQAAPPNVVLIIADDYGFTDFGFMGHPTVKTPHIDRLAEQSARFPNGYVPTSLCRPSLVTLLTGLYPHQHGVFFNDPPDLNNRQQAEHFIREAPSLPRILGEAGYRSFQTGKLWEGSYRNAGFTHGMTHGDPKRRERHPTLGMLAGRHGDKGLTIGRDSMEPIKEFIDSSAGKPFFVWYAPMMPHTPFTPPEKYKAMYAEKGLRPNTILYYAMCTWFDDTVGDLLGHLDSKGLADNTLVIFVIDNGWITNDETPRPTFAPRSKRSPFEMGLRTPILIRWPGRTKSSTHVELVSSIDIVPTVLAAAGLSDKAKDLPGLNLLPVAEGKEKITRAAVFGEVFEHSATTLDNPARDLQYRWVRRGDWKLIDPADLKEPPMLFNLRDDPKELNDLSGEQSGKQEAAELQKLLDDWWKPAAKDS